MNVWPRSSWFGFIFTRGRCVGDEPEWEVGVWLERGLCLPVQWVPAHGSLARFPTEPHHPLALLLYAMNRWSMKPWKDVAAGVGTSQSPPSTKINLLYLLDFRYSTTETRNRLKRQSHPCFCSLFISLDIYI